MTTRSGAGSTVFRKGRPLPPEERGRRRGAFGRLSMELEREGRDVDLSFAEAARRMRRNCWKPRKA